MRVLRKIANLTEVLGALKNSQKSSQILNRPLELCSQCTCKPCLLVSHFSDSLPDMMRSRCRVASTMQRLCAKSPPLLQEQKLCICKPRQKLFSRAQRCNDLCSDTALVCPAVDRYTNAWATDDYGKHVTMDSLPINLKVMRSLANSQTRIG